MEEELNTYGPDDDEENTGGDEALAAFDSSVPLVDMVMRSAATLIGHLLRHGFTAPKVTRRSFIVAMATLAQNAHDVVLSQRIPQILTTQWALASDDWDEGRGMVVTLLSVLLRQWGGDTVTLAGQKRKRLE